MIEKYERNLDGGKIPKWEAVQTENGIQINIVDKDGGHLADLLRIDQTGASYYLRCEGTIKSQGYKTDWAKWDGFGRFCKFSKE